MQLYIRLKWDFPTMYEGGKTIQSLISAGFYIHRCLAVDDTILEYVGSCHYISVRNETLPCKAWEYDRTYYESTIVTDARIYSRFTWPFHHLFYFYF